MAGALWSTTSAADQRVFRQLLPMPSSGRSLLFTLAAQH
jgi:hypothetical protein